MEKTYLIMASPISEWSWIDESIETDPISGEIVKINYVRQYGNFWNYINNKITNSDITPTYINLISESPMIKIKNDVSWGIEIIPTSRFNTNNLENYINNMKNEMDIEGIEYKIDIVSKSNKNNWFSDNGFSNIEEDI